LRKKVDLWGGRVDDGDRGLVLSCVVETKDRRERDNDINNR
jgi:hypothetical protein